jgi:ribosome-associated protein
MQSQETAATDQSVDSASSMDSVDLAKIALDAALDKKALEPLLLNVDALCSYTEHILILSGRSDRQVDAIAEGIKAALREQGRTAMGVEGKASGQWALLDYGDLIVHVFHHPIREHYDLESLWSEAVHIEIEVPEEARIRADESY